MKITTTPIQQMLGLTILLGFVQPTPARSETVSVPNLEIKTSEEIIVAIRPRRGRGSKADKPEDVQRRLERRNARKAKPKVHSPVKAGILSLVPGLGQFYNKQKLKGVCFFVLTGLGVLFIIIADDNAWEALNSYEKAVEESDFDALFGEFEKRQKQNKSWWMATTAVYTINIADAVFFANKKKMKLSLIPGETIWLSYRYDF